ncbi:disease resistance protein RPV1-like [Juglans regia]|uniref:Disease resistance protein RPV1-like n=1 Tax=Juglans regia TaxID=51240 RepID=A0A6P9EVR5_JUGRE|nr:disease resistance protein RPV1-like [Juglans regia]
MVWFRVGRKTLVEVIYDRISYQFEASTFIACIREETRNRGLVSLQKQLLSKIFMEREINIWDDREGMNMVQNRLCYKNVFLVLVDVDREEHLTALAGSHYWFGPGSRIILKGRDNHLLKRHGVNYIYKVNELNNDEALQLFSLANFKKPYPEENYVDLSKGFVKYAQDLHLALKVLGSSLVGRGTNAWKGAWDQLKANPNKGILDILQAGFDGLEDLQKKLFLDIACFFNGEVLDNILMDILKGFGYYPYLNIDILMEKCLITISSKRLRMHDFLQKMGQEKFFDESQEEPVRCSRLWHYKDVLHVLKNNTSFGSLKRFDLSDSQNLLETPNFTGVPSLETLDLDGCTNLSKSYKRLKSFPNEINSKSLEHFYLSDCSRFEKFPDIVENMTTLRLSSLKILDVSDCLALGGIQDMNGEGYLEQLYNGGTAIKFTKFFTMPEFGSNDACSTQ